MRQIFPILGLLVALALSSAARAEYVCDVNQSGHSYTSLRTGPGPQYPETARLRENIPLTIRQMRGDWIEVSVQAVQAGDTADTGWVLAVFVCPKGTSR